MTRTTSTGAAGTSEGRDRSGVTLLELLVTLSLLSLLFGVAVIATHTSRGRSAAIGTPVSRARAAVTSARRRALATGQLVSVLVVDSTDRRRTLKNTYTVTAFPDGSVLAESLLVNELVLDRLNGSMRTKDSNVAR